MIPNPGLSTDFNRYAANLDCLLPRRSRKGDRSAQFLHSALGELAELHMDAAERLLQNLLSDCEDFHRRQLQIDPDYINHDDGACWLPLVIVGKGWTECVSRVLELDLPESVGRARRIVLKPASRTGPYSLTAIIREQASGVTEAAYNRFVSQVKGVFPRVESVYDPDSQQLQIHRGNKVSAEIEDRGSPLLPSNGGIPPWLETLLHLNVVDILEFHYPLGLRDMPAFAECVCATCILPECPPEWRTKETFPSQIVLASIADSLGQGPEDPFHLCVTAVQDEWLPLIDACVQKLTLLPRAEAPLATESCDGEALRLALAARGMTLHPGLNMRDDSEYESLRSIYQLAGEGDHVLVPVPAVAAFPVDIVESLSLRLNDLGYLRAWATYFQSRTQIAIEALSSKSRDPAAKLPRGVTADFLVRVNSSVRDFAACVLASLEKSLGVLVAVEDGIAASRASTVRFQRMCSDVAHDDSSEEGQTLAAIGEVIRLAVDGDSRVARSRALAAVVYALMHDDVIRDSEEHGRVDDLLVLAAMITDDRAGSVREEPRKWAHGYLARMDGLAGRAVQDRVLARYEQLVERIEAVGSDDASNPTAHTTRKSNRRIASPTALPQPFDPR